MEEEFKKYVQNFNFNDEKIRLKYEHSLRVMKLSLKYAKILKFSDYEIALSGVIGLLHDIGRFNQLKFYNTFSDTNSIDHAKESVKILFDDKIITNFWINNSDYNLIKFAILNHNKFKIDDTDNLSYSNFAKLIRDVDKLDILYLKGILKQLNILKSPEPISIDVLDCFDKNITIPISYIKNDNDLNALYLAYAFDINYDVIIDEFQNNLDCYYKTLNNEDVFKECYQKVNNYLEKRIFYVR